ncbi:MAG: DNA-methyltransferase [Promethearchaeota archaeon]
MEFDPIIFEGDCREIIRSKIIRDKNLSPINLSFLDPPFNQQKKYENHMDDMKPEEYWEWMTEICKLIYDCTSEGGSIYFMQREKNTEFVLRALRDAGWTFQNLIIWRKKTSAVPQSYRYGKQFQIIAFATKGDKPTTFNRLRIDLPLMANEKKPRENGVYVTDVWIDIRELTSGYFAGDEALRDPSTNKRLHKQQAPVALLLRIILSSTQVGDLVLDPFTGTGTTNVVAMQLNRRSIGIEKSPKNIEIIKKRTKNIRKSDDISKYKEYYRFTSDLDIIWGTKTKILKKSKITDFIEAI